MHQRWTVLGLTLALAVPACGRSAEPVSTGSSKSAAGDAGVTAQPADTEGLPPTGQREAVGRDAPDAEGTIGYVNWGVISGRTAETPPINPIYAEDGPSTDEGTVIGYWALGLGWLTPAEYNDPGFDYDSQVAERRSANQGTMPEPRSTRHR
jgi:hypothetical protein